MPTYDYKNLSCKSDKCKKVIEKFHSMSEVLEETVCENCGKTIKVTKMLTGNAAVHFRGAGFFVNDYKKYDSSLDVYVPREEGSKKIF